MASQSLLYLMRTCKDAEVDRLLAKGKVDVNEIGDDGVTPLHVAAAEGNTAWIKRLLELGARPDVRWFGKLPVQHARTKAARSLFPPSAPAKKTESKAPPTSLDTALSRLRVGAVQATFALRENGDTTPRRHHLMVFDWRQVSKKAGAFLSDTFNDGFVDGYLDGDEWVSEKVVPFAFASLTSLGKSFKFPTSFCAILFFDLERGSGKTCPVLYVPVDGTADPGGFRKLTPTIESLRVR